MSDNEDFAYNLCISEDDSDAFEPEYEESFKKTAEKAKRKKVTD